MRTILFLLAALVCMRVQAQDTTPYNCEHLTIAKTGSWAAPMIRDFCESQEAHNGQTFAKLQGKPRPSIAVYELPAYGSSEAKRTGISCVGGTALQRAKQMGGFSCATVITIGFGAGISSTRLIGAHA